MTSNKLEKEQVSPEGRKEMNRILDEMLTLIEVLKKEKPLPSDSRFKLIEVHQRHFGDEIRYELVCHLDSATDGDEADAGCEKPCQSPIMEV